MATPPSGHACLRSTCRTNSACIFFHDSHSSAISCHEDRLDNFAPPRPLPDNGHTCNAILTEPGGMTRIPPSKPCCRFFPTQHAGIFPQPFPLPRCPFHVHVPCLPPSGTPAACPSGHVHLQGHEAPQLSKGFPSGPPHHVSTGKTLKCSTFTFCTGRPTVHQRYHLEEKARHFFCDHGREIQNAPSIALQTSVEDLEIFLLRQASHGLQVPVILCHPKLRQSLLASLHRRPRAPRDPAPVRLVLKLSLGGPLSRLPAHGHLGRLSKCRRPTQAALNLYSWTTPPVRQSLPLWLHLAVHASSRTHPNIGDNEPPWRTPTYARAH